MRYNQSVLFSLSSSYLVAEQSNKIVVLYPTSSFSLRATRVILFISSYLQRKEGYLHDLLIVSQSQMFYNSTPQQYEDPKRWSRRMPSPSRSFLFRGDSHQHEPQPFTHNSSACLHEQHWRVATSVYLQHFACDGLAGVHYCRYTATQSSCRVERRSLNGRRVVCQRRAWVKVGDMDGMHGRVQGRGWNVPTFQSAFLTNLSL